MKEMLCNSVFFGVMVSILAYNRYVPEKEMEAGNF